MILFNDSEWQYNFIILMTLIIVLCGIYTFIKIQKNDKKNNTNNNVDNKKDNDTNN